MWGGIACRLKKLIDIGIWHNLNAHDEFFVSLDGLIMEEVKLENPGVPQHIMVERTCSLVCFHPYSIGEDWVKRR